MRTSWPVELDGGPLLGRASEQARLERLLEADTPVVLVGEAGVGKTRLAREAIRASGRSHLEGGGFKTLAWVPYLALERAIGRSLAGADQAFAAAAATRAVGAGILLIDDLQWVDADTRDVVGQLADRVAIVVCVRRGDAAAEAAIAGLPAGFVRVDVEPLEETTAAELAVRVRPALTATAALALARRAGGNPLLVGELAAGGESAPTLGVAVRTRLAPLGDAARDAMLLLALAERPMPVIALGAGAGDLVTSGLAVLDRDGTVRVRHELIAAAAAEAVPGELRQATHRRLARLSTEPGQRARHHAAGGERARARRCALEAAAGAATLGEKAAHLELAAGLAAGARGEALRVEAARALIGALQPGRALEVLGDLRGANRPDVALAEARALRMEYELGPAREAIERAHRALREAQAPQADLVVQTAIEDARLEVAGLGDVGIAVSLSRQALELATEHGVQQPAARAALGAARLMGGDLAGLDDLANGLDEALAMRDVALGLEIGHQLVFGFLRSGRHAEGSALARRLGDEAHRARLAEWELRMAFWASGFAWHGGDFDGATKVWATFDVEPWTAPGIDWYEIHALADLGRLQEARIRADRYLDEAKPGEYDLGESLWLAADIALLAGRWRDALRHADRHAREIPNAHHRVFVELSGAWATYELGLQPNWPQHHAGMPIVEGGPPELEGIRALANGAPAVAVDLFDEAAEGWAGRHARGELRSRWAAGESLRLAGRASDARSRLLALEERLDALGHLPLLARTQRSLRLLGVRRSAARSTAPTALLTDRERQVLEMNARGLRDGEIATQLGVSRWAILRASESAAAKLGATTRAEAVARALAS